MSVRRIADAPDPANDNPPLDAPRAGLFFPETQAALDVLRERCRLVECDYPLSDDASERDQVVYHTARAILWLERRDRENWDG